MSRAAAITTAKPLVHAGAAGRLSVNAALARIEEIAWQAYQGGRKSPVTAPAGPGFADPTT